MELRMLQIRAERRRQQRCLDREIHIGKISCQGCHAILIPFPGAVCAVFFHHVATTRRQRCSFVAWLVWLLLFEKRSYQALLFIPLHVCFIKCLNFICLVTEANLVQEHLHGLHLDDAVSGVLLRGDVPLTTFADMEDASAD